MSYTFIREIIFCWIMIFRAMYLNFFSKNRLFTVVLSYGWTLCAWVHFIQPHFRLHNHFLTAPRAMPEGKASSGVKFICLLPNQRKTSAHEKKKSSQGNPTKPTSDKKLFWIIRPQNELGHIQPDCATKEHDPKKVATNLHRVSNNLKSS